MKWSTTNKFSGYHRQPAKTRQFKMLQLQLIAKLWELILLVFVPKLIVKKWSALFYYSCHYSLLCKKAAQNNIQLQKHKTENKIQIKNDENQVTELKNVCQTNCWISPQVHLMSGQTTPYSAARTLTSGWHWLWPTVIQPWYNTEN